jgi:hypothetical protein
VETARVGRGAVVSEARSYYWNYLGETLSSNLHRPEHLLLPLRLIRFLRGEESRGVSNLYANVLVAY